MDDASKHAHILAVHHARGVVFFTNTAPGRRGDTLCSDG